MKNEFVSDGFRRWRKARKELSREAIHQKHEQALATASPDQKEKIPLLIEAEFQRQQNHKPSAATLW